MLIQTVVALLFLTSVRTSNYEQFVTRKDSDVTARFSWWPSMHNGAKLMRLQKRDTQGQEGASEGVLNTKVQPIAQDLFPKGTKINETTVVKNVLKNQTISKVESSKVPGNNTLAVVTKDNATVSNTKTGNVTKANITSASPPDQLDLNKPGAIKRGLIVFGGFTLLAFAYFIFYRTKKKISEGNNQQNDTNQFRYGVLESEDKTELSRIPLTMESDDDEDEDLEIFDLGQKNKTLSYVNLQTNDYDVVVPQPLETDQNNLLLDIEDASEDTLINWSKNGSKAIL